MLPQKPIPPEIVRLREGDLEPRKQKAVDRDCDWPRPIPVSERLPESPRVVLAFAYDEWSSADFKNGMFAYDGQILINVTHWLPLPPKPDEPINPACSHTNLDWNILGCRDCGMTRKELTDAGFDFAEARLRVSVERMNKYFKDNPSYYD